MKQENEKKLYEPPALTAVTFKAEKGYAASSTVTNYLWGASQLWGADEHNNTASDYSWGDDQNWN